MVDRPVSAARHQEPQTGFGGIDPSMLVTPRTVRSLDECEFYHSMELPGHGLVSSGWDFRAAPEAYLGNLDLRGQRVLDVGPASGFFSFHLERTGADVVAFEIAREVPLDLVPYARGQKADGARESLDRVMNSFWYAHRLLGSRVQVAQGNVYAIPESIGEFDAAVVGSVLLHLRDPFLALSQVAKQVRETLIVAEPVGIVSASLFHRLLRRSGEPKMMFLPNFRSQGPVATWWTFTPELLARFMAVLGFERTRTIRHTQRKADGTRHHFFTVVGQRTRT